MGLSLVLLELLDITAVLALVLCTELRGDGFISVVELGRVLVQLLASWLIGVVLLLNQLILSYVRVGRVVSSGSKDLLRLLLAHLSIRGDHRRRLSGLSRYGSRLSETIRLVQVTSTTAPTRSVTGS